MSSLPPGREKHDGEDVYGEDEWHNPQKSRSALGLVCVGVEDGGEQHGLGFKNGTPSP